MNSTERERIDWDEYGMFLAYAAAQRSPDPYMIVGAAAFRRDRSTVSTGYNGAPAGAEIDWTDRDKRRPYVLHAEANCLKYAAQSECYYLYVTLLPCKECLLRAAAYGVKEIIYDQVYERDTSSLEKAGEYGINIRQYSLRKLRIAAL
jgi:dCMP deaminase